MKAPFSTQARKEVFQAMNDLESVADGEYQEILARAHEEEGLPEEKLFKVAKNSISILYEHLRDHCYEKLLSEAEKEGVKAVILLVQDTAEIFHDHFPEMPSLSKLKEFQKLQELYLRQVIRPISETTLGKWIFALTEKAWGKKGKETELKPSYVTLREKKIEGGKKHYFVDLESIKNDIDYDLLFLLKEDGSRFFSPKLIRSMKLILSFEKKENKGFYDSDTFEEERFSLTSRTLLLESENQFVNFWHAFAHLKTHPVILLMRKAYMALFMSSISIKTYSFAKGAKDYFFDFQNFFSEVLTSQEYRRWLLHEDNKHHEKELVDSFLSLVDCLISTFFTKIYSWETWLEPLNEFMESVKDESDWKKQQFEVGKTLEEEVKNIHQRSQKARGGLFSKLLELLEDEEKTVGFSPLMQGNIPSRLFTIQNELFMTPFMHMATPTVQQLINKAQANVEFIEFLRLSESIGKKMLLVNFQDRTIWKEFARSQALEKLSQIRGLSSESEKNMNCLQVVSLPVQTEFFRQSGHYYDENQALAFFEQIKVIFGSEESGFYIQEEFKSGLKEMLSSMLQSIHKHFFDAKNVLSQESRVHFLHILYLFCILWMYQKWQPEWMSFLCKDGVDISSGWRLLFFSFLTLFAKGRFDSGDFEHARLMLIGPALFLRDRAPLLKAIRGPLNTLALLEQVLGSGSGHHEVRDKLVKELVFLKPYLQTKCILPDIKDY